MSDDGKAVFVGMRFAHMRNHAPSGPSDVMICDDCGVTDVVFEISTIAKMAEYPPEERQVLCNICVVPHLEEALRKHGPEAIGMEMTGTHPGDAYGDKLEELVKHPDQMLEAARRAAAELKRQDALFGSGPRGGEGR